MNQSVRQNSGIMLGSAMIMLLYGWFMGGISSNSSNSFYRATVSIVDATLKFGSLVILASGIMSYLGLRAGMVLGLISAGLSGLIMVSAALYWFVADRRLELLNFVMLLIGGFLLADARLARSILAGTAGE